jgi:hypothetical protein
MLATTVSPFNTRLGCHYFPDSLHYRASDLHTWLPELRSLGLTWLVLHAPIEHVIPEPFLQELQAAKITPLLHFHFTPHMPPRLGEASLLFHTYARWGLRYSILFDRPNLRSLWPTGAWTQTDLVERFLDSFLPLAEAAQQAGLTPIFPPLEPGGDYWDTAFLWAALKSMQRRASAQLLETFALSAYAPAHARPLNWGAGGPERWPATRPYITPPGSQDQCGFRIFDWYLAISQAVLGQSRPLVLCGVTCTHAEQVLTIAPRLAGQDPAESTDLVEPLEPIPPAVLACNFQILPTSSEMPNPAAWFTAAGHALPPAVALRQWTAHQKGQVQPTVPLDSQYRAANQPSVTDRQPIMHYLLLPAYEWGIADWHLEVIRPYIKKYRPTIGFSLAEAAHAVRVTVIGGPQSFPEAALETLQAAGCHVERICGSGTEIATLLETL